LELASFTEEKFALYSKYQQLVHNDPISKIKKSGFKSFLVDTPITVEPIPSLPGKAYGSYHGLYRLDGNLIAFSVIDILPGALSSVYFVWDPDYSALGLGKLSALQEIGLTREWSLERYMMGFYIHDCVKMKYKASYEPSQLLDPVSALTRRLHNPRLKMRAL
jgi:arginine-tRNA-protein transferase